MSTYIESDFLEQAFLGSNEQYDYRPIHQWKAGAESYLQIYRSTYLGRHLGGRNRRQRRSSRFGGVPALKVEQTRSHFCVAE